MSENSLCLSCLSNENIFNIFDVHECDGNDEVYHDMLKFCFDIDLSNEALISGMCEKCILILRVAYFFKQNTIKNIAVLQEKMYTMESQLDPQTGHLYLKIENQNDSEESYKNDVESEKIVQQSEHYKIENLDEEILSEIKDIEIANGEIDFVDDVTEGNKNLLSNQDEYSILEIFICDVCDKQFTRKNAIKRHVKTHQSGKFVCTICNQAFQKLNSLNSHVWRVHRASDPYGCTKCGKRFKTYHKRLRHIKKVHNLEQTYKCPHCDKVFFEAGARSKHVRSKHLKIRNHKCTVCDSAFFKRRDLLNHLASVHDIGNKEHSCWICQKTFFRDVQLKLHMKVHVEKNGNAKYRCDICDDDFYIKSVFNNHMLAHKRPDSDDAVKRESLQPCEEQVIVEDHLDESNDTVYFDIGDDD